MRPLIQLSFDVEEFDMPLEYGFVIPPERQLELGFSGLEKIKPLLSQQNIRTTLFTTANFADHFTETIQSLSDKHEIASHTYHHSRFETADLISSRLQLEKITGKPVTGLRMPRMRQVPIEDIKAAGYAYDASVHPTWLPGRYNNLHMPRRAYISQGLVRVPASVSPIFRLPLFWLAFKNYPYRLYKHLCQRVLHTDGYLSLYFHPWEFTDVSDCNLPAYTVRGCKGRLLGQLHSLCDDLSNEGEFVTMSELLHALNMQA